MAALSKCNTCSGVVAVGAKACPHCGVSNPAPKTLLQRPFALFMILGVGYIFYSCSSALNSAERSAEARQQSMTPEQKAEAAKTATRENAKHDAFAGCQVAVQKQLKNPKSFDVDMDASRATLEADGSAGAVYMRYRATNSFNAVVPGAMTCKFSAVGERTTVTAITAAK